MTVAVVALAIALAGTIGALVWFAHAGDTKNEDLLALTKASAALQVDGDRARFEADATKKALALEQATVANLEEALKTYAIETDPNADLAPDDVAGRVLRAQARVRAAGGAGDPVRADAGAPVLADGTQGGTDAARVPGR